MPYVEIVTFPNPLKDDTLCLAHIVSADTSDHIRHKFQEYEERDQLGFVYNFLLIHLQIYSHI